MKTIIFGGGLGVITAAAGISIVETPLKAILVISAICLLFAFTRD